MLTAKTPEPRSSFWCLSILLRDFLHCSYFSIFDFEQVNVSSKESTAI